MVHDINGGEFYELVQRMMNDGKDISKCEHIDEIQTKLYRRGYINRIGFNISCTLTEYRRILSLLLSDGAQIYDLADVIICDDYEMCTEWMKYTRNEDMEFNGDYIYYMNIYAVKFDIDIREMFKYMFNDGDEVYLRGIRDEIIDNCFDCCNDTEEIIDGMDKNDRYFSFHIYDIRDRIEGKLIDLVSWSLVNDSEYVFFSAPDVILDEESCRAIVKKLY